MSLEKPFSDIPKEALKKSELWSIDDERAKEFMDSGTLTKQKVSTRNINRRQDHYIINQYKVKPDPFKILNQKSKFKIPLWLVVVFLAIGLLAILGGLAAILIAALAPRKYVSYNQVCDNSTKACDPSKNLVCTNSRCACASSNFFWNTDSSDCENKKSYGDSCSSTSQCYEMYGLSCSKTSNGCNCPLTSTANMCDCPTSKYFDENTKGCVTKLSFGSPCTFTQQCTQTISLICSTSGTCACPTNQFYKNGKCNAKLGYNVACGSSSECDETEGLVCTSSKCNCPTNFYYDTTLQQCNAVKSYGASCNSNTQCDFAVKKLICNSNPKICYCGSLTWSYIDNKCQ